MDTEDVDDVGQPPTALDAEADPRLRRRSSESDRNHLETTLKPGK